MAPPGVRRVEGTTVTITVEATEPVTIATTCGWTGAPPSRRALGQPEELSTAGHDSVGVPVFWCGWHRSARGPAELSDEVWRVRAPRRLTEPQG